MFKRFILCLIFYPLCAWSLQIHQWQTKNGVPVYFVARHQLPIVDLSIVFNAGSARDRNPGLAAMTQNMLVQGAGPLNADQTAQIFDQNGAVYSTTINRDISVIHLRSLSNKKSRIPAINLLHVLLTKPTFPKNAFARIKKDTLTALHQQQQSPAQVAIDDFYQTLYDHHPYATPVLGTLKSVSTIQRADLEKFYRQFYVANNAMIAMVGDLDLKDAKQITELLSKDLSLGKAANPLPTPTALKAKQRHIQYPSAQTTLILGGLGIQTNDPDLFALKVGNYILGGGGAQISRLFEQVRSKHGWCYSVSSIFIPMQTIGPFYIQLQTHKASNALHCVQRVLSTFLKQGPTDEEVHAAKQALIEQFPMIIAENSKILLFLEMIGFYHLPLDYLDRYAHNIAQISAQQIRDAFKRHINANQLIQISVGN